MGRTTDREDGMQRLEYLDRLCTCW